MVGEMLMASSWAAAAAPPGPLLRPARLDPPSVQARHLILAAPLPRRSALRSDHGLPAVYCHRGESVSSKATTGGGGSYSEWDWNRWTRHFSETDQAESFSSLLKFQLEEAVEREDFLEAAKLKVAIAEATSKDTVAEVMSELEDAIQQERYHDASRLCMLAGSGLVGWWVGCTKDSDNHFGRIVRINPAVGRYVAKSYSPRQLMSGSSGTPLFEIFLAKDDAGKYITQAVALQPVKEISTLSSSSSSKSMDGSPISSSLKSSTKTSTTSDEVADKINKDAAEENKENESKLSDVDNVKRKDSDEEGLKSIINFFKERIPGFNAKLANTSFPEEINMDVEASEQLVQEEDDKDASPEYSINDNSKLENIKGDMLPESEDTDSAERKNMAMKLFIGGVLHNKEDSVTKSYKRIPAEMRDVEKDLFTLYVPGLSADPHIVARKPSQIRVASVAAQSATDLMPSDVANIFLRSDKAMSKVSEEDRESIKLGKNRLSRTTIFNRITTDNKNLDPFDGLYVSAFAEVVQLQRKYGHWNGADEMGSDIEFFEYVEAVKLTGDLDDATGQVTFRAKIGKGNRLYNQGIYPEELGVVASYKGQGRISELGLTNLQWVDGELLQLNGKGLRPYFSGKQFGFLYNLPEKSFLVLFEQLKLPD